MASSFQRLFNWVPLTRYRVQARDMSDMIDNGMVPMIRSSLEGMLNGSVIRGLGSGTPTGLNFTVNAGIAIGPTGNVMVLNAPVTASFTSPTTAWGSRNLVVIRPLITTPSSGIIATPTVPGTTTPLFFDNYAQVIVLDGQAASGNYPATGANDVILFGTRLAQGATGFTKPMIVSNDRDTPGRRNALLQGQLLTKAISADERLLAYNAGAPVIGVKSSQTQTSLSYSGNALPSIFPKSGGLYNGDAGDTFINFTTGVISGADTTSSAFTPTIPAVNSFIWALIVLNASDTLTVIYGISGTYNQCRAALKNQTLTGAGAVPQSAGIKLAYVLLGSVSTGAVTELDVFDARSFGSNVPTGSTTPTVNRFTSATTLTAAQTVVEADCSAGSFTLTLPTRSSVQGATFTIYRIDSSSNVLSLATQTGDTINSNNTLATTYVLPYSRQGQQIIAGQTFYEPLCYKPTGYVQSSSCNAYSTTSSTPVAVPNLTLSITTSGRPLIVGCTSDQNGTSNLSYFGNSAAAGGQIQLIDSVNNVYLVNFIFSTQQVFAASLVLATYVVPAGTYTFVVKICTGGSGSMLANYLRLYAYEI